MVKLLGLKDKIAARYVSIFFGIYYTVGLLGLSYAPTRLLFTNLMPLSLLMSMGLLFLYHQTWHIKHVGLFGLVAILGFGIEVVGVLTGEVFGLYQYGGALGYKLWGTPLMIGVNWLMLIYMVYAILKNTSINVFLQVLLGALMMVGYDIVLEPVAIQLDMWSWGGGAIPLQNYVAWYVISVVLLSLLHGFQILYRNPIAIGLLCVQWIFFILLNILL